MGRFRTFLLGGAAFLVLFPLLTFFFVPNRTLLAVVSRSAADAGLVFSCTDLGKVFPVGLRAKKVTIGSARGEMLTADEVTVRFRFLPLFLGRVEVSGRVGIGGGQIDLLVSSADSGRCTVTARGIRLDALPLLRTIADGRVTGLLSVNGTFTGLRRTPAGSLQLEVTGADLREVKVGGMPLPDAGFDTARGALRLAGNRLSVESLALQGKDLYLRVSGDLPLLVPLQSSPLNLTLELMPKPDMIDRQKLVFLLLSRYADTPGHYRVPIRGTLGAPAVQ